MPKANMGSAAMPQVPVDPDGVYLPLATASADGSVVARQVAKSGTDRSATATTTSSSLMGTNTTRARLFIKNDTAIDVWINLGATAAAVPGSGNIRVAANGGYFELENYSGAVNIIAASSTAAVTAREF